MLKVMAVEDDPDALKYLVETLQADHEVSACSCGREAIEKLRSESFDLILADLNMPPPDGFAVLRAARLLRPPPAVVVISALDSARATMDAVRLGARDYLLKPAGPEEIRAAVARAAPSPRSAGPPETFGMVGESPATRQVRRLIPLLARSRETALILGETGTGKELLARALHEHGPRRTGPFIAHNMAATPTDLAESLFFGHARGSFSGAIADHAGLFEQAHGGILFLDEVDSFPIGLQAKLLRVLESRVVQRLGSPSERPVDARVIAASAVDLGELTARGAFRADLYYRLRQLEVVIPPLRERLEDVPALMQHFLDELEAQTRIRGRFSIEATNLLLAHSWPGNCRELRNTVRSASLLADSGLIEPAHLPRALQQPGGSAAPGPGTTLRSKEEQFILEVLEQTGGNRSRAARLLGIDRGTLARKLRALGVEPKRST